DDHLLAQALAELRREDARHDIERAAGGEWHHHGHRPGRPVLRRSGRAEGHERRSGGCKPHPRHCRSPRLIKAPYRDESAAAGTTRQAQSNCTPYSRKIGAASLAVSSIKARNSGALDDTATEPDFSTSAR